MAKIEIYVSPFCGFCVRAKQLLSSKGVDFMEIDIFSKDGAREEMIRRTGGRTSVPQIFADGNYVGDCIGIHELEAEGNLDIKLGLSVT